MPDDLVTVRVPNLTPNTTYREVDGSDLVPVALMPEDKLTRVTLAALKNYFQSATTGGGGTTPSSAAMGNKYIYVVPAGDAGGRIGSVPSLAGKTFNLNRGGLQLLPSEYTILSGGGFELTDPDAQLQLGERFVLEIFEYTATPGGGGTVGAASFLTGAVEVPSNKTINAATELNKLFQVRAGSNAVTLTLPLLADVPDFTIIPIETAVLNDKQTKIQTQGGQFIYMNDASFQSLYMGLGESLWLFKKADGFYVINDFGRNYDELARPAARYVAGLNELVCKGQLVNRADYPRLWEMVQALGFSLVDENVWQTATGTTSAGVVTAYPYKGCFSRGDGSLTFRLPDLMGATLRGLVSEGGTDAQRYFNRAGGKQASAVGEHDHKVYGQDNDASPIGGSSNEVANVGNPPPASGSTYFRTTSKHNAGVENTMENVGIFWVIKA